MRKTLLLLVSTSAVTRAFSSIPGCSVGEDELRQKRVQTLLALDSAITSSTTSTAFSFDSFSKDLSALFTLDTTYDVPNGAGPYVGLTDSAEYWALSFPAVNGNLFSTDIANVRDKALSIDGDVWTALSTTPMTWFPTVTPSLQTLYKGVTVATFAPCSEKIDNFRLPRHPSFAYFTRNMAWTAIHSTYAGGMFDVCALHEKYCTGEHRQYDSFASCLSYLTALPDVPVGCPWAPFAGSSKPCKLKHKLLVPFQAKHCYHMGPLTRADGTPNYDPDGQLKCSDAEECPAHPKTDFVLGEPTGEFLDAMNAYDAAIATAYHNPITNFSLDHYKFPNVAAAR